LIELSFQESWMCSNWSGGALFQPRFTNPLRHPALSTRSPRPQDVSAFTHSPTSTEFKSRTQPATSTAVTKKRRLLATVTLPGHSQHSSQPKRAKPEPDNLESDEEWLSVPPGLFPPSSADESEVGTRKQYGQVEVSKRDRRVQQILADQIVHINGQPVRQYRIKWLGYPIGQTSWEIEDDLYMADVMLKDYRSDRAIRKARERTSHERQPVVIDLTQEDD